MTAVKLTAVELVTETAGVDCASAWGARNTGKKRREAPSSRSLNNGILIMSELTEGGDSKRRKWEWE